MVGKLFLAALGLSFLICEMGVAVLTHRIGCGDYEIMSVNCSELHEYTLFILTPKQVR